MLRILLMMMALACVAGCTTYHVTRPDGTELHVRSMREFPDGIAVEYQNTDGTKQSSLKVQRGSVQNGVDPRALQALLQLLLPPVPVTPNP